MLGIVVVLAGLAAVAPTYPISHPLNSALLSAPENSNTQPSSLRDSPAQPRHPQADKGWWQELRTDPIADFTALLFISTAGLWWVTVKIRSDGKVSSERQLRAYISVLACRLEKFAVGEEICVSFRARNHGQVPASAVHSTYRVGIFPPNPVNKSADNSIPAKDDVVKFTLFPKADSTLVFRSSRALSDNDFDAIKANRVHIHVWGVTSYNDGFGKVRITKFDTSTGGDDPGSYWQHGPNNSEAT
ncbi:MAG TPA: hypothetical protein VN718_07285 [Rhizomicrobium sp.]|nr:hypothetical protein [Rhizomicrobium sp.]